LRNPSVFEGAGQVRIPLKRHFRNASGEEGRSCELRVASRESEVRSPKSQSPEQGGTESRGLRSSHIRRIDIGIGSRHRVSGSISAFLQTAGFMQTDGTAEERRGNFVLDFFAPPSGSRLPLEVCGRYVDRNGKARRLKPPGNFRLKPGLGGPETRDRRFSLSIRLPSRSRTRDPIEQGVPSRDADYAQLFGARASRGTAGCSCSSPKSALRGIPA